MNVELAPIDLLCIGSGEMPWTLGERLQAGKDLASVCETVGNWLQSTGSAALLFWDPALGRPEQTVMSSALNAPVDLWHAGLSLGMGAKPVVLDFVNPAWMFNRDPEAGLEATSWRLSLRACLVRAEVLRKMQFLFPGFATLEAAGLEWGHRLLASGVVMRHSPKLLPPSDRMTTQGLACSIPFEDDLRFAMCRFGKKWTAWALFRAILAGHVGLQRAYSSWRQVVSDSRSAGAECYRPSRASHACLNIPSAESLPEAGAQPTVSVLIPTIDRYSYLKTLLNQLRCQTVPPIEVIVVDQTSPARRNQDLPAEFADLPLKWICQDTPGQCSSRNSGLAVATGEFVLMLDDDVEVEPDLIAAHLKNIKRFHAAASCGVAEEVGAGPLPPEVRVIRASDVFPAGNTLIRRATLKQTGMFDLAFENGARADADLGMRFYLSGGLVILDGGIQVLHHHAPRGGLRSHRVRTITRASSRTHLFHRNLLSTTELYLAQRYFSSAQVDEAICLRALGTFSIHGSWLRKIAKAIVSATLLPDTLRRMRASRRAAQRILRNPEAISAPVGKHLRENGPGSNRCTSCM